MLTVKCFVTNMVSENCYVVSDETKEAVIIDDGAFSDEENSAIDTYITEHNLVPKHLLCTHAHFDHTLGCCHIYEKYGLKPLIHLKDTELYLNLPLQIEAILGHVGQQFLSQVRVAPVGDALTESRQITFGSHTLAAIETPGHTPGGVCLYCESEATLFSGDSIFQYSIGRTDFPGGDHLALVSSIKSKLLPLPVRTIIYPGHGATTTIQQEKLHNPYLV